MIEAFMFKVITASILIIVTVTVFALLACMTIIGFILIAAVGVVYLILYAASSLLPKRKSRDVAPPKD